MYGPAPLSLGTEFYPASGTSLYDNASSGKKSLYGNVSTPLGYVSENNNNSTTNGVCWVHWTGLYTCMDVYSFDSNDADSSFCLSGIWGQMAATMPDLTVVLMCGVYALSVRLLTSHNPREDVFTRTLRRLPVAFSYHAALASILFSSYLTTTVMLVFFPVTFGLLAYVLRNHRKVCMYVCILLM